MPKVPLPECPLETPPQSSQECERMKRRLTIELDESLYNELERISKELRLSKAGVIRLLILNYLKRERGGEYVG